MRETQIQWQSISFVSGLKSNSSAQPASGAGAKRDEGREKPRGFSRRNL